MRPRWSTRMFDEAERRDPEHQRSWVVLVDGNNHQIDGSVEAKSATSVSVVDRRSTCWGTCGPRRGASSRKAIQPPSAGCRRRRARSLKARPAPSPPRSVARPPARARGQARGTPKPPLPTCPTSLSRLPDRARERVADRDRRDRGDVSPFGQGPDGHHRRALGTHGAEAILRLRALGATRTSKRTGASTSHENATESTKPATPVGSSPPHRTRHDVPPGEPHPFDTAPRSRPRR